MLRYGAANQASRSGGQGIESSPPFDHAGMTDIATDLTSSALSLHKYIDP